jgi:ABC-type sugar transport system ATPase subunit
VREALRAGLALVPEDRREHGLVLDMPVDHNVTLGHLSGVCRAGFLIDHRRERQVVEGYIRDLNIKAPSPTAIVKFLSGGNQQKVVVAKWLFIPSHCIVFDEPTRGIDVQARYEIYALMQRLAADGVGVMMISSDLPELIGICHRILVMHEGRMAGELNREQFSQERIMAYATGG